MRVSVVLMLLKADFTNTDEWKAVLHAISDITDEAMFICNKDGITFRGMDPSHVALLEITFPRSSFGSFECDATFFGVHVNDLRSIISVASSGDAVELRIDDPRNMNIRIAGALDTRYTLNLIERTEVNTPVPKVHSKSRVGLSPVTLSHIISNIERVSDYVTISAKPEMIQFAGDGMVGKVHMDVKKTDGQLSCYEVREDSSSVYSLEYMSKIIRNIGRASKNVNMEYGTKTPIRLLFEMESEASAEYYLAPRVDN